MEFSFIAPAKVWSTNDDRRLHWAQRSKLVKEWRDCTAIIAKARRVGSQPPSVVTISIPFARNGRRDPMNYVGTVVKAMVDGLVDAGVWPDDTPEYVEVRQPRFVIGGKEVVVTIEPFEK